MLLAGSARAAAVEPSHLAYEARVSAISVQRVSRFWGTTRAIEEVSFEATAGRLLVLLGPSGCGKSTTLRLIAGLEEASAGRILIGGRDVTRLPPARRGISMVFQSYALFPHLSVAENILFGLRVRRVGRAERARRLDRVAGLLGLSALLGRKPAQLSGGQQQRVALGRALISEAPVCLMDEPLSNLDAQLRGEMRHEIRALQQQLGITVVYVTHDQTEAMTMADQVVLLRDGVVEQDATPPALYAKPLTLFAARFIGTPPMNTVALEDANGGAVIRGTAGPVLLRHRGEGLVLGVRPEAISLGGEHGIPATIETVEFLGADSLVTGTVGTERLTTRVPGRLAADRGIVLQLSWRAEEAHLFDASDGRRRDDLAPLLLGATQRLNLVR
jgi:sn-glycerol 3-phosphate transport system ATP-binding protein